MNGLIILFFEENNQGVYEKVFLYKKEIVENEDSIENNIKELKTIEEIKNCEMDSLFYQKSNSTNTDEYLSAVKIDFFIRKERDIEKQALYQKNGDKYILYNNNIDPRIRQNEIYVIVKETKDLDGKIIEREFRKVSELINADRKKLFIKLNEDEYISLLLLLKFFR